MGLSTSSHQPRRGWSTSAGRARCPLRSAADMKAHTPWLAAADHKGFLVHGRSSLTGSCRCASAIAADGLPAGFAGHRPSRDRGPRAAFAARRQRASALSHQRPRAIFPLVELVCSDPQGKPWRLARRGRMPSVSADARTVDVLSRPLTSAGGHPAFDVTRPPMSARARCALPRTTWSTAGRQPPGLALRVGAKPVRPAE